MGRATKGRKDTNSLDSFKASYRNARDVGDKEEEAKWANQIGHACKDRGEYVTALKWFRKDYEISSAGNSDPLKLMPTCQSIGEVYLRLQNYDDALTYQRKHFHLAEQAGDLVEQQRASTQLGRTYIEIYETSDRLSGLTDSKAYFQTSLELACRLRCNPPSGRSSPWAFVVEQVDAYNNLGLARALAEDYEQAFEFYSEGLKLCDEEEVDANDAARSRIHHNLGRLYVELRDFDKARFHTEKDVEICQKIPHAQGEAKGLMNLANLYFKSLDYEQATRGYKRALQIAQTLEDEDSLCSQIKDNLEVVSQAKAKSKTFHADMQKLSKLRRDVESSKGTAAERSYMKQECALLQELAGRAEELQAWDVHLGLAKRMKRLTKELGDKERLGDALEIVASSYYTLRHFQKAMKWHRKSFELCKRIGHLEGQIVAKINYGNALDASGKPEAAMKAYQEAFEAAKSSGSGKMLEQQINALDNIHYCYFVRLENLDEARKAELQLKQLRHAEDTPKAHDDDGDDRCSETGSEGHSEDRAVSDECIYVEGAAMRKRFSSGQSQRSKITVPESDEEVGDDDEEIDDDVPLSSFRKHLWERNSNISVRADRGLPKQQKLKTSQIEPDPQLHTGELYGGQGKRVSAPQMRRDRRKWVVSDDEKSDASLEVDLGGFTNKLVREPIVIVEDSESDVPSSGVAEIGRKRRIPSSTRRTADEHVNLTSEEGTPPFPSRKKSKPSKLYSHDKDITSAPCRKKRKPSSPLSSSEDDTLPVSRKTLKFRPISSQFSRPSTDMVRSPSHGLDDLVGTCNDDFLSAPDIDLPSQTVHIPKHRSANSARTCPLDGVVPPSARETSGGPCPVNKYNSEDKYGEGVADTEISLIAAETETGPPGDLFHLNGVKGKRTPSNFEQAVEDMRGNSLADIDKSGLVNTLLLKCYMKNCMAAAVPILPNSSVVNRLRSQKVSEEVVVAGCNIQDNDAQPLLAALGQIDALSLLDMSHNLLGNSTMHAIQQLIKSTNQTDLGLTLDLHCNKLGAGALLQICRCPVSLSRLEVLDLSSNRLTDAAARHLSKILKESQALAALNVESCALTTRSIKQLTSALNPESSLTKLCIGKNNPIAGFAIQELLSKLSMLTSFSELDLKGVELDEAAVAGVSTLIQKSTSISTLVLQGTDIGNDGALALANALDKSSRRLAKLDLSRNGFDMESASKLCSRLMSIRSLSNLNLSGNHLDQKATEVMAQGLAQTSCRLKALDLSRCHIGQAGVLLILQSLTEQTSLLELNLAGNIERQVTKMPQPDESAVLDCRSMEGSEGEAESSSAKLTVDDYMEENCPRSTGGGNSTELPADSHLSQACPISLDCGQQKPERGAAGNEHGDDHAPSSLNNVTNSEAIVHETHKTEYSPKHDLDGIRLVVCDGRQLVVCLGPSQPEADAKQITPEGCEERVMESVPDPSSRSNGHPVQADPPEVDSVNRIVTEPSCSAPETKSAAGLINVDGLPVDSMSVTSAHDFCEQLATSIRLAKMLRQLDLSNNELGQNDIDLLYLAWSASPRGNSGHQKHADGSTVQFFIGGQPCPSADRPCCHSH